MFSFVHDNLSLQFFKLDVLYEAPEGGLAVAPGSHIVEELHRILRAAPTPAEYPVGILTTEHRDTWYQARERLIQGVHQLIYVASVTCIHHLA